MFGLDDNALKYNQSLILISFIVLQTDEKARELSEGVVQPGCAPSLGPDGTHILRSLQPD